MSDIEVANKEVPVEAMENIQTVESIAGSEELSQQTGIEDSLQIESQEAIDSAEIPVFEPVTLYTTDKVNCRILNTTESEGDEQNQYQ